MSYKQSALLMVWLGVLGFLLSVGPVWAGPENLPQAPPPPKPAPEMAQIDFLVGTWSYTETYEKNPLMPQGGTGKGTYTARRGPGGLSIISEFQGNGPIGAMSGVEFLSWDAKEKVYKAHGVSNYLPGISTATGKWEGDKLVFAGELEVAGVKLAMKYEYTDMSANSVTITVYQGPVGGELTKIVTTRATKVTRAPAKRTQ